MSDSQDKDQHQPVAGLWDCVALAHALGMEASALRVHISRAAKSPGRSAPWYVPELGWLNGGRVWSTAHVNRMVTARKKSTGS